MSEYNDNDTVHNSPTDENEDNDLLDSLDMEVDENQPPLTPNTSANNRDIVALSSDGPSAHATTPDLVNTTSISSTPLRSPLQPLSSPRTPPSSSSSIFTLVDDTDYRKWVPKTSSPLRYVTTLDIRLDEGEDDGMRGEDLYQTPKVGLGDSSMADDQEDEEDKEICFSSSTISPNDPYAVPPPISKHFELDDHYAPAIFREGLGWIEPPESAETEVDPQENRDSLPPDTPPPPSPLLSSRSQLSRTVESSFEVSQQRPVFLANGRLKLRIRPSVESKDNNGSSRTRLIIKKNPLFVQRVLPPKDIYTPEVDQQNEAEEAFPTSISMSRSSTSDSSNTTTSTQFMPTVEEKLAARKRRRHLKTLASDPLSMQWMECKKVFHPDNMRIFASLRWWWLALSMQDESFWRKNGMRPPSAMVKERKAANAKKRNAEEEKKRVENLKKVNEEGKIETELCADKVKAKADRVVQEHTKEQAKSDAIPPGLPVSKGKQKRIGRKTGLAMREFLETQGSLPMARISTTSSNYSYDTPMEHKIDPDRNDQSDKDLNYLEGLSEFHATRSKPRHSLIIKDQDTPALLDSEKQGPPVPGPKSARRAEIEGGVSVAKFCQPLSPEQPATVRLIKHRPSLSLDSESTSFHYQVDYRPQITELSSSYLNDQNFELRHVEQTTTEAGKPTPAKYDIPPEEFRNVIIRHAGFHDAGPVLDESQDETPKSARSRSPQEELDAGLEERRRSICEAIERAAAPIDASPPLTLHDIPLDGAVDLTPPSFRLERGMNEIAQTPESAMEEELVTPDLTPDNPTVSLPDEEEVEEDVEMEEEQPRRDKGKGKAKDQNVTQEEDDYRFGWPPSRDENMIEREPVIADNMTASGQIHLSISQWEEKIEQIVMEISKLEARKLETEREGDDGSTGKSPTLIEKQIASFESELQELGMRMEQANQQANREESDHQYALRLERELSDQDAMEEVRRINKSKRQRQKTPRPSTETQGNEEDVIFAAPHMERNWRHYQATPPTSQPLTGLGLYTPPPPTDPFAAHYVPLSRQTARQLTFGLFAGPEEERNMDERPPSRRRGSVESVEYGSPQDTGRFASNPHGEAVSSPPSPLSSGSTVSIQMDYLKSPQRRKSSLRSRVSHDGMPNIEKEDETEDLPKRALVAHTPSQGSDTPKVFITPPTPALASRSPEETPTRVTRIANRNYALGESFFSIEEDEHIENVEEEAQMIRPASQEEIKSEDYHDVINGYRTTIQAVDTDSDEDENDSKNESEDEDVVPHRSPPPTQLKLGQDGSPNDEILAQHTDMVDGLHENQDYVFETPRGPSRVNDDALVIDLDKAWKAARLGSPEYSSRAGMEISREELRGVSQMGDESMSTPKQSIREAIEPSSRPHQPIILRFKTPKNLQISQTEIIPQDQEDHTAPVMIASPPKVYKSSRPAPLPPYDKATNLKISYPPREAVITRRNHGLMEDKKREETRQIQNEISCPPSNIPSQKSVNGEDRTGLERQDRDPEPRNQRNLEEAMEDMILPSNDQTLDNRNQISYPPNTMNRQTNLHTSPLKSSNQYPEESDQSLHSVMMHPQSQQTISSTYQIQHPPLLHRLSNLGHRLLSVTGLSPPPTTPNLKRRRERTGSQ